MKSEKSRPEISCITSVMLNFLSSPYAQTGNAAFLPHCTVPVLCHALAEITCIEESLRNVGIRL